MRVLLKREDLAHTGSHKLNNVIGQACSPSDGQARLIAETGAGQHGVASATAAAFLGMDCVVYMGEVDIARQALNVFRMELLGAEVRPVRSGSRTLKDAVNEALRDWVATVEDTHYCLGSVMGPHPYPWIVREFQRVVGDEAREQCRALLAGADPDLVVACVGGGSNAAGTFAGFVDTDAAAGRGRGGWRRGNRSRRPRRRSWHAVVLLQDEAGQIVEAHSISAGLDYPGIGPEHAHLRPSGRARYEQAGDDEVLAAFRLLSAERRDHPRAGAGPCVGVGGARGGPVDPGRVPRCS